jgi:hypothetical protein
MKFVILTAETKKVYEAMDEFCDASNREYVAQIGQLRNSRTFRLLGKIAPIDNSLPAELNIICFKHEHDVTVMLPFDASSAIAKVGDMKNKMMKQIEGYLKAKNLKHDGVMFYDK